MGMGHVYLDSPLTCWVPVSHPHTRYWVIIQCSMSIGPWLRLPSRQLSTSTLWAKYVAKSRHLRTSPCPPSLLQERCLQSGVVSLCLEQLEEPNPVLRQWLVICLGRLWQNFDSARWYGARDNAHEKLINLLWDEIPDVSGRGLLASQDCCVLAVRYVGGLSGYVTVSPKVRAAAVFALGTYVLNMSEDGTSEMRITIDQMVGSALLGLINDGSSVVRKVSRSLKAV